MQGPPEAASCPSQHRVVLLVVVLTAAGLRVAGIDFGLPLELRPDEEVFRVVVARMAETGDFNPHRFEYGGPLFYALYGVTRVVHAARALADPEGAGSFVEFSRRPSDIALIQRAISMILGVGTVLLVYGIGRRVQSSSAGLVAASLLAVMFLPVRDSHFGTVDIPAAFASTWALSLVIRAGRSGTPRSFAAAGVVAGLATAIRYGPCVIALPLWITAWRAERAAGHRRLRAAFGPRVWLAASTMVAGFLVFAPYTVLAFDEFRRSMLGAFLVVGDYRFDVLSRLWHLAVVELVRAVDWPFAAAGAIALIVALFGRNPAGRAVALFVVAYACLLSTGMNFYLRWLNPIIPGLCVLVGSLLARVSMPWKLGWLWCGLLTLALAAVPAVRSISIDRLFLRETTFQQAAWVLRHQVPRGSAVACANPHIAHILDPSDGFVPWDPFGLAARPEWYAVVPRHPIGGIGEDPCMASVVLPAMGDVTSIAEFTGLDPSNWHGAVFEHPDFFFYPLRGFEAVVAAGPDFRILRISQRPAEGRAEGPPPPRVLADVRGAFIHLAFEPPSGVDVVAYYLRWAPETGPNAGVFFGPFAVAPGAAEIPFSRTLLHGRYAIVAATIGRKGVGPWSEPVTITFE